MTRAKLASLVAAVAFAVAPAAALAQDSGGGQYVDPLDPGNEQPSNPPPPSSPSPQPPATGGPSPTATASTGSTAGAATTYTQGPANEIPRTGFPVGMLMFAGALCLSGGLALRRAAGITGA